jgi:hypothetical protein
MFLLAGPVGFFYNIDESYWSGFHLNKCCKCGVISIVTQQLSWACRACGEYNGDHDLIGSVPVLTKPLKWLLLERE